MRKLIWVIGLMAAGSAFAQTVIAPSKENTATPVYGYFPSGRTGLELGTRSMYVTLQSDKQGRGTSIDGDWGGSYLGSLNYIDESQDYSPIRFYAQQFFTEYIGFGVSYDAVEAKTLERDRGGDPNNDGPGDGYVGAQGPIIYFVGRMPTETIFTPFLELGLALYSTYFDENAEWSRGGTRYMETEDTTAFVLGAGCDVAISDGFSVNLYARWVAGADVDTDFMLKGQDDPVSTGSFPLDYIGFGLGVKYAF